jgi:glycosyltransferase involved in cell wall biosynthesis
MKYVVIMSNIINNFYTIVIPVYEDWEMIYKNLNKFKNLVCENVDVVFVDNGSRVVPYDSFLTPCRLLVCEKKGSYSARNVGIRNSNKTSHFIFTDADCTPDADWLTYMIEASLAHPSSMIAGDILLYSKEKKLNVWEAYDSVFSLDQRRYVDNGHAATANLLIPNFLILKYGMFSESSFSGGDVQYTSKLTSHNVDIYFNKDAKIYHPTRADKNNVVKKIRRIVGGQITHQSIKRRILYLIMNILFIFSQSTKLYLRRKRCATIRDYMLVQLLIPYLSIMVFLEIMKIALSGKLERR